MPQIIVTADRGAAFGEGAVTLRERVNVTDFESEHFATQLVERLGWAVGDADDVERVGEVEDAGRARPPNPASSMRRTQPRAGRPTPSEPSVSRSVASVVTTASYTPAP